MATDIDLASAEELVTYLNRQYGVGRAVAVKMDVTNEESVRTAFVRAALAFGGVDVFVNNPGLASSASITETTLAEWNKSWNVLATGYLLVAREGFRLLQAQGRSGNLVFLASKNALVAGKNAAAYSTAKAAETHLALPGGRWWSVRHPREYRQSGRDALGLAHLGQQLATRADGNVWSGS